MSKTLVGIAIAILIGTHFFYYPKWNESKTEATISWDVSGYYFYLPAIFIYKDIKNLAWKDEIFATYQPTPELQQAYIHEASGNYVMKYSIGQAVLISPGFFAGHLWASISSYYPADGFSFPYQFSISMWVLLVSILGLLFLRKSLLYYFGEWASGLSILGIVIGSNYLNYAAIDGAMTHNTLFTIYSLLIYMTIRFYQKPDYLKGIAIGLLVGLAALTRPTEIIAVIIPLLWGVNLFRVDSISDRVGLFWDKWKILFLAVLSCGLIGMLQPMYWKYATGEWIVYSYQEQGFSWLKPHLIDGIFSYKSGWLTYSPFMIFSLIGFIFLYRKFKFLFFPSFLFCALFIYIAFAWDIWWYGGSLGQRAMVQSYAVFAFPLAALFSTLIKSQRWYQGLVGLLMAIFIYANLWFTHQAHLGGIIHVGQMRKAYFWKTLFTYEKNPENLKLLDDVNHLYEGDPSDLKLIFRDSSSQIKLDANQQNSPEIKIPINLSEGDYDWLRVSAEFSIDAKEWFFWTMTHFIVEVRNNEDLVSSNMIRVQRLMNDNETKSLFIDLPKPKKPFTELVVKFWNANGNKEIRIKDIRLETFKE